MPVAKLFFDDRYHVDSEPFTWTYNDMSQVEEWLRINQCRLSRIIRHVITGRPIGREIVRVA